ncbi:sepiapterin reductase-like [Anarrhichthys ocellatus]|uniref:sepiapterin reductase-like n=1 Tax=Anarrhichthys ocellatus TaxID=433405 RepID=UPI0012ECF568|nr:sepiapterin reductase-like [Anarrhichthys ocellatus]
MTSLPHMEPSFHFVILLLSLKNVCVTVVGGNTHTVCFEDGDTQATLVTLPFLFPGSLGDVSRYAKAFTDMAEVDSYLSLNVSSSLCLTASVLQAFPQRPGQQRTVVNITSLCALQPFRSWVLYCTSKAAREMMFRVLAEEEPDLRVLSYSPGPLDTDMQMLARSRTADPSIRKSFSDMSAQGQLLTCEASCAKLMKLLLEDNYTTGAHVDVYDV